MSKRIRNTFITLFVILWTGVFHYESIRYFYLNPFFKTELPKVKFLFPPAGWIMFYSVGNSFGNVEVYGIKDGKPALIDPHHIFRTRTIGFDNIHRNILSSVSRRGLAGRFCGFLEWRFPYYDRFVVTSAYYPDITKEPFKRFEQTLYQCQKKE